MNVAGDLLNEPDETFRVNLSSAVNATIADTQATGTIVDDDAIPTISINDPTLTEGNSGTANMTFTLTLSAASGRTVTVAYATSDGTATQPADYSARTGTVTFTAGQVSRTFTVPVVGDTLDEFDETFVADLATPTNATIAKSHSVATIVDNDALPTISTANVTVTEGDSGTAVATFTVSLSAASAKPITVDFATADGTATAGADYEATSGTLSWAPGEVTKTVAVTIDGDLLDEANETFTMNLTNPTNATDLHRLPDRHHHRQRPHAVPGDRRRERGRGQLGHLERHLHRDPVGAQRPNGERQLRHRERHRHRSGRLHGHLGDALVRSRGPSPGRSR